MNKYSSTSLKLFSESCPQALAYYEAHTPVDTTVFQVGVAAHAVIEAVGKSPYSNLEDTCRTILTQLVAERRTFRGTPEPPMGVDAAIAGRDIALEYIDSHPLPDGSYELELGMDIAGNPCAPDSLDCRYFSRIDLLHRESAAADDDEELDAIVTTDWKTAWTANSALLDSLQLRGHSVLAGIHNEAEAYTRRVVNLRTHRSYSDTVWDTDTLDEWKRDILALCDSADTTREVRVGINCMKCNYLHCCESAKEIVDSTEKGTLAERFILLTAHRDLAKKILQAMTDQQPFVVDGGVVGTVVKNELTPNADAIDNIMEAIPGADIKGLLMSLGLTIGNLRSFAKTYYKGNKDRQREFIARSSRDRRSSRFGIWPLESAQ